MLHQHCAGAMFLLLFLDLDKQGLNKRTGQNDALFKRTVYCDPREIY